MSEEIKKKISKLIKIPAFLGFLIGILAALLQAMLISAGGPEAYMFCVACHTRDLMNDSVNEILGVQVLGLAPISAASILPILSIVGVLIGAFIAAWKNKEYKLKKSSPLIYFLYTIGGVAVICLALLLGGCPYRAALRFGYGDLVALIGIISMAGGVAVGVSLLLYQMKKSGGI